MEDGDMTFGMTGIHGAIRAPRQDGGTPGIGPAGDTGAVSGLLRGTSVRCVGGARRVESLRPGDLVETADGGCAVLRRIARHILPAGGDDAPVCIAAGTLGNSRALTVSPGQRVLLGGWQIDLLFAEAEVLAPAEALVNGVTITRAPDGFAEIFVLIFDRPEIIFAEEVPVESAVLRQVLGSGPRPAGTATQADPVAHCRPCLRPHEAAVAASALDLAVLPGPSPTCPDALGRAA
jgi:hypothetical protein